MSGGGRHAGHQAVPGLRGLGDPVQVLQVFRPVTCADKDGYRFGAFSNLSLTFVSKFISTHVALEGPLPCVPPVVVLQLAAGLETFLADIAHKPGAEC